jgi:hypothetical protein
VSELKTTRLSATALLRIDLMDAIQKLKDGKMKPEHAQAMAALSAQVLASAKLDLDVAKFRATQPIHSAAIPSSSTSSNGNGNKLIDYDSETRSESLVKTIRANAESQARETYRAWLAGGNPATRDFEDGLAQDYGLDRAVVTRLREEVRTCPSV